MKRALLVALVVCALGGIAAAVQHVLALREATSPPSPQAFVQAAWTVYRLAPGHRIHVGQQGLACKQCHEAADEQRFDKPSPSVCADCHEKQTEIRHVQTGLTHAGMRSDAGEPERSMTDCLTCHGFGPDPEKKPSDCLSCHARAKHDVPAIEVHADQACTRCHDVHANKVAPIECGACHQVETQHGEHPDGSPAQCLDCHHAHAPASFAGASCERCHQSVDSKVPVPTSATHGEHTCLGCHTPHTFGKSEVQACTSCHQSQHVLEGAGHGDCQACHEPHDVKGSVERKNVCLTCHGDVALHHQPRVDPVQSCISCHVPHAAGRKEGPEACTSCHAEVARADHVAHAPGMACTGCHKPHDFTKPLESRDACLSCHKPRVQQLAGTGHARCEGCHEAVPHGGMGAEVACASCHEQGSQVHPGHQTCTQCHDAHTGARAAKLCVSCHQAEAAKLNKQHGDCQSCHEPHVATPKPEIAACTGCHQVQKLPALHQVPQHSGRCQSCHEAHPEKPPADAETCRSCHRDKRDHQPEATQCSGCHPFAGSPSRRRML